MAGETQNDFLRRRFAVPVPMAGWSQNRRLQREMMDIPNIHVDAQRLHEDLRALGEFGRTPGGGLMRTALSKADLEARSWFAERMRQAGLHVRQDSAANVIGRLNPPGMPNRASCIAMGSHIDSVPNGGIFDGSLGVCCGLEAIRAIQESGLSVPVPLELLVFTDEEGEHYAGTFGSRAMLNLLAEGEIYQNKKAGQPSIAESLQRIGSDPARIMDASRLPSEFIVFLEVHIEQGPVLEAIDVPIGIVEGIVCIDRHIIRVEGKSGHAGTTPMSMRKDALVHAARLITAINEVATDSGTDIVATIGDLSVSPGGFNVIPGRVEMHLDLRTMNPSAARSVRKRIRKIVEGSGDACMEAILSKSGVSMDSMVMEAIESSCRARGLSFHRMVSGAGHDAMTFQSREIPTGMIFIPCKEGKSHCPDEEIREQDATIAAQILADTVMRIAHRFLEQSCHSTQAT